MFDSATGVKLDKWVECVGLSKPCVYRWIREGMLRPTNILGSFYITQQADAEFWARAAAGEFAARPLSARDRKQTACSQNS